MISFKDFSDVHEKYVVKFKKDSDRAFNELLVSDDQFLQAYRYLKVDEARARTALAHLDSLGLGKIGAQQILSIVLSYDNTEAFFNALDHKLSVQEFQNCRDLVEKLTTTYNLQRGLVESLLLYEPPTKPSTGKGEAIICIFVDGARKGSKGDVTINGKLYETKGTSGRLSGTSGGGGWGSVLEALKAWRQGLMELAKKADIPLDQPPESFSIGKKELGPINALAPYLIASGKVTRNNIIDLHVKGFMKLYLDAQSREIKDWISRVVERDGTFTDDFLNEHFIFAFQYYAKREHFDYLVSIGTVNEKGDKRLFGKMNIISMNDIMKGNILDKMRVYAAPGYTTSSGSLGSFFSVAPVIQGEL